MNTPQQADNQLAVRAAYVARSAPENWQRFIEALAAYSSQQSVNCVQSPLDELPRMQGRAQAAARLHELLASCLTLADKIEGRK